MLGFDIEHLPYHGPVPEGCELVLQDVLTLHGSQFRDAACIVASPPCQAYSYRAMPWKRAKALPPPSNELFDACFRIQREASEAAGHRIPLVVENVKGAQPWVGPARAHFGSYYLWGDVDSVGGRIVAGGLKFGQTLSVKRHGLKVPGMNFHEFEKTGKPGRSFQSAAVEHTKNDGGSWFDVAHNTESGIKIVGTGSWFFAKDNPDAFCWRKNGHTPPGLHNAESGTGRNPLNGVKQPGHSGRGWFADPDVAAHFSSKSDSRKAASAQIAEIPLDLACYIARAFKPPIDVMLKKTECFYPDSACSSIPASSTSSSPS